MIALAGIVKNADQKIDGIHDQNNTESNAHIVRKRGDRQEQNTERDQKHADRQFYDKQQKIRIFSPKTQKECVHKNTRADHDERYGDQTEDRGCHTAQNDIESERDDRGAEGDVFGNKGFFLHEFRNQRDQTHQNNADAEDYIQPLRTEQIQKNKKNSRDQKGDRID